MAGTKTDRMDWKIPECTANTKGEKFVVKIFVSVVLLCVYACMCILSLNRKYILLRSWYKSFESHRERNTLGLEERRRGERINVQRPGRLGRG